jgi:hypothetical protein
LTRTVRRPTSTVRETPGEIGASKPHSAARPLDRATCRPVAIPSPPIAVE